MSAPNSGSAVVPLFLPGSSGNLFALYHPPQIASKAPCAVLYFQPFAEEMNKTRRMVALQAQHFAAQNYGVLILDLFGTGESTGDFGDARWEIWRDDVRCAIRWLEQQEVTRLVFWGVRSGALLALDTWREFSARVERIVLWQPVTRGEQMMTQFLRLRLVADLMTQGAKITTQDLRNTLYSGQPVEIAGYTLAPELVLKIDRLELKDMAPTVGPSVDWIEIVTSIDRPISPQSSSIIEAWRAAKVSTRTTVVAGEPFWNTSEITVIPELLERTTQCLIEARP